MAVFALESSEGLVKSFNFVEAFFNEDSVLSFMEGAVRIRAKFWSESHTEKQKLQVTNPG